MKNTILLLFICGITLSSMGQQVPLKGVVTVQNSKTNTGQTQYVKNAEVEHTNEKNAKTKDVTGNDGKFTLNIKGIAINTQIQIAVNLYGDYADYMVVNEKEIKDLTLGRTESVNVYVCKKGELEQRRAEMVGVNMKKYRDQIKQLQKELEELKDNYDYGNSRYKILENQIDSLNKLEKDRYLLIKEWAESLTTINLDDANEKYVKAFNCFAHGYLDSIDFYLPDNWLKQQKEQLMKQQAEGQQKIDAGQMLISAGQRDVEAAKAGLSENAKSWMLKAKATALENKYDLAISYYEEAINTDPSNVANMWEFANYLYSIREYPQAEKYYQQCLKIYRHLEKENSKAYLPNVATTLNNLANLHKDIKEYAKAIEGHEEALKIRRTLAKENPKKYLPDVAMSLNNLAIVHKTINQYPKALEEYKEALEIRRKLAKDNPAYLPNVATTLNNLGSLHKATNEYPKALEEYKEALELFRKLAAEDPKNYLPDAAMTLYNLAILHKATNEYSQATKEAEEALEIYQKLASENPRAYLLNLTSALVTLSSTYSQLKDFPTAIKHTNTCNDLLLKHKERLNYKPRLAQNYTNLSWYYLFTREYAKSEQSARQALEIDSTSLAKTNLAHALLFQNRFPEAEKIYKELSTTIYEDNQTYSQTLLEDLDTLEAAQAIPEARKADMEKIRKMLKN